MNNEMVGEDLSIYVKIKKAIYLTVKRLFDICVSLIGLIFLIILHINFNKNYFKAIPKGKYTLKRTINLFINIGLLISLTVTIISGILSSQKSMKNLTIGKYKIKHIHKSSSIFSLIFLGLHLLTARKKLLRELKKLQ